MRCLAVRSGRPADKPAICGRLGPHFGEAEEDSMTHTNRGRVILGGLLAGLVINIVEFVTNGVVLREAWGQAMQALGKPAQLSAGAIVSHPKSKPSSSSASAGLCSSKIRPGSEHSPEARPDRCQFARRGRCFAQAAPVPLNL